MRTRFVLVVAIGLLASCLVASRASGGWQRFEAGQGGLADNVVSDVLETKSGVLWFATAEGVSRFDGNRWQSFGIEVIPGAATLRIAEEPSGALWLGTLNGGAVRYDGQSWRVFSTGTGDLPSNQAQALAVDQNGDVWCGTETGLSRYWGGTDSWTTYTEDDGSLIHRNVTALHEDQSKNLWVGTAAGVSRLDPTRTFWTDYPLDPQGLARDSVLVIDGDTEGGVWFGTDGGAFRLKDGVWTWFNKSNSGLFAGALSSNEAVFCMFPDDQGGMWLGGDRALSHFNGRTWRTWTRAGDGSVLDRIQALQGDSSGNIWIASRQQATTNGALYRFDRVEWINAFPPNFNMTDILEDSREEIWVTTADRGVFRLNRNGVWTQPAGYPLSSEAVYEDSGRNLWVGLIDAGLMKFDPDRVGSTLFGAESLPGLTVHHVLEDRAGNLWAATSAGVAVFDGTVWQAYLDSSGTQPVSDVFETMEDQGGSMWFRSSTGLYRLDPQAREPSRIEETIGTASGQVTAFLTDKKGVRWFGTTRGLSRLESTTWTEYPFLVEPGDTTVYTVFEDSLGGVWAGSLWGATRFEGTIRETFNRSDLGTENLIAGFGDNQGTVWLSGRNNGLFRYNGSSWRRFDTGDGLGSNLVTHIIQDSRGNLWFGSYAAITEHRPDRTAPQTIIISASPQAVTGVRDGTFVFGSAFGGDVGVEYQVHLDGMEERDWSEDETWDEFDLPDGVHTLEFIGRDWIGNVDPTPATFVWEIDATQPPAALSSPVDGPVRGMVEVVGTAADPRFQEYAVQLRPVGAPDWTDLTVSSTQIVDGVLASWNTTSLPDGFYELRLVVTDTLGLPGTDRVEVLVDNQEPFADVTAPVTVSALRGGDAYSIHGEFHLYFPPGAFSRDVVVKIEDTVPPTGTSGEPDSIVTAAVVTWEDEILGKVATLDAWIPETAPEGVSLFHWTAAEGWVRLGGTPRGGQISSPITEPGTYTIATSSTGATPLPKPVPLSLTPRIFSPTGGFADTEVAISFNLERSGPVEIKVFNRAGRLIRRVLDRNLEAGTNLVRWDGRNEGGDIVPDGLYIVAVKSGGQLHQKTVSVVR